MPFAKRTGQSIETREFKVEDVGEWRPARNRTAPECACWLTIHESVGHPTELDRVLGYEANYAGKREPWARSALTTKACLPNAGR